MMRFAFFGRRATDPVIDRLHGEIVAAVRQPIFYRDYGIGDTFDGRFELLALCSTIVVHRLMECGSEGQDLAQELTDGIFSHLDGALREMGTGDLAVPRRIKALASALLGRRQAYVRALGEPDDRALAAALARNVYAGQRPEDDEAVLRLARYVRASVAAHEAASLLVFREGPLPFPDPAHMS